VQTSYLLGDVFHYLESDQYLAIKLVGDWILALRAKKPPLWVAISDGSLRITPSRE
jgi:hypothetical protein